MALGRGSPSKPLAGVLVLAAAAAGCGGDDPDAEGTREIVGTTVPDAVEVVVTAENFSFSPAPVEIPAGVPVNLVLDVVGGTHDLRVDGIDVRLPVRNAPDSAVTTVQVDEPGEYRMICTVIGHLQEGMETVLVVR